MIEGNPYNEDDASKLARDLFSGQLSAEEALKRLRTRLLDLSLRNRLLNYRHPKGRSFQFVDDPDLNLVFERLRDGRAVSLGYVPEPPAARYDNGKKPDARTYAREQSINTSPDVGPSARSTHYKRLPGLQVLQYPADLERSARKIASEAKTVVEETGTNMLYLMFGFLEYYDSEDSDKPVLAPLLSMPVSLTKGALDAESRTYLYEVAHSGEDIVENFTLREKLRQLSLELPPLKDEDSPDDYLASIEKAVSRSPRWAVRRRLSLGFLSFGKLAIWADLDPAKAAQLLSSGLLRKIFEGGNSTEADAGFHAEDYEIDSHVDGELPLIYDADSSQHSALIDVKNGKSLVVNGPPGTGKSQTITNIIATAIADGKKVLFVSEKLAALEVVKHRLEAAGLGDFCLELHSHKTQKKQLLESIDARLTRKYSAPSGYGRRVETLRERRETLNWYAKLLGSKSGNTLDLTVHEIFWTTERNRQALGDAALVVQGLNIRGARSLKAAEFDQRRMVVGEAANALGALGHAPDSSPWTGFSPKLMIQGDEIPVVEILREALARAQEMVVEADLVEKQIGGARWTISQFGIARDVAPVLQAVAPELNGPLLARMFAKGVSDVPRVAAETTRLRSLHEEIRRLDAQATQSLHNAVQIDPESFEIERECAAKLLNRRALERPASDLIQSAERVNGQVARVRDAVGGARARVNGSVPDLHFRLNQCLNTHREVQLEGVSASSLLLQAENALRVARAVQGDLQQVSSLLDRGQVVFSGHVDEVIALLDGRGIPDLLPEASTESAVLDEVRRLCLAGLGDWTSAQFSSASAELAEMLASGREATDELRSLFSRISIPVDVNRSGLEAIDVLLTVVEEAPLELLPFRAAALGRPDFPDVAIRAEEECKSLSFKATKIEAAFYMDMLPDEAQLRQHVSALRSHKGFLSFFSKEWRAARSAFRACSRSREKIDGRGMCTQFAGALAWRSSLEALRSNTQFRDTLGALFNSVETDFGKLRKLHGWVRDAQAKLLSTDLGPHVNPVQLPDQHLSLLVNSAARIRQWIGRINALTEATKNLPGMDPALSRVRRVDELIEPLSAHVSELSNIATLMKSLVRAPVSLSRAGELIAVRRKVQEHEEVLARLRGAPALLTEAAAGVGLNAQAVEMSDLRAATEKLQARAASASEESRLISTAIGDEFTARSAVLVLSELAQLRELANEFLSAPLDAVKGDLEITLANLESDAKEILGAGRYFSAIAPNTLALAQVIAAADASVQADKLLTAMSSESSFLELFGSALNELATDIDAISRCVLWGQQIASMSRSLPAGTAHALLSIDVISISRKLAQAIEAANRAFDQYAAAMQSLQEWGALDWQRWGGSPYAADAVQRLELAIEGSGSLVSWSRFLAAKEQAAEVGLGELLAVAEKGRLNTRQLVPAYEFMVFRSLSRALLAEHKELARFSGEGHERLRTEFAALDKELISLNGALYASKVDAAKKPVTGVSAGRAGDLTEMALITKETKKQKRHIPIRQLVSRAGKTLLELKPCFMMGPLAVAQYLEQGQLAFDLVVMDEASQLRPEDALGAIARGSQLVVVGDPKQLPPTNFFDRLMEDADEDPDDAPAVVEGVESILGICEQLFRPVRTLRWHYRSRHESLIAFSNSRFYDHRLVVFPSPYRRNRRLGVNYRYVANSVYQDRRNVVEAQAVVEAVVEHMLECPEESLGVVTLNQTQKELIEDLLDKRLRNLPAAAAYFERHEGEGWPFFVKNLENVQGDERDVIFVSATFGRPPGSSQVRQNFGPINRPDGWRRLNVLFTRARRRVDLFTSMRPGDVRVDEKASLGRRALHEYLEYARSGRLPVAQGTVTDREPDSDFEISVANALRARGYEAEPQLGVAGYFIDLGVRHPDRRGEFLAGIECDGATYHSSLSARDRDRIRQEILESLGWRGRIVRVWSTDWFGDPVGQTDRLVRFLDQRRQIDDATPRPYSDEDLDEVDDFGDDETADRGAEDEPQFPIGNDPEPKPEEPPISTEVFVDLGDQVTYETMIEPVERHTVQIVDSPSNLKLGIVNDQTPLAQALLGLCVGEWSELKIRDQAARKLKVIAITKALAGPIQQTVPMPKTDSWPQWLVRGDR